MSSTAQITEHMEVVGSDGHHIGKVDHLLGEDIELSKFDFGSGLKHHLIPRSWIDHVDTQVHLKLTSDEAKTSWRESHH
jgi:hypothetical protein